MGQSASRRKGQGNPSGEIRAAWPEPGDSCREKAVEFRAPPPPHLCNAWSPARTAHGGEAWAALYGRGGEFFHCAAALGFIYLAPRGDSVAAGRTDGRAEVFFSTQNTQIPQPTSGRALDFSLPLLAKSCAMVPKKTLWVFPSYLSCALSSTGQTFIRDSAVWDLLLRSECMFVCFSWLPPLSNLTTTTRRCARRPTGRWAGQSKHAAGKAGQQCWAIVCSTRRVWPGRNSEKL